ncbi:Protoporphyrinogen oxidase [Rubripirellula lacrimiformis]|uniref:Coproporphyrinogen III oxidase n=1 Tax=Rubripirellula lacrimiformis TaxID=1930273 RepID=A0A517ND33_9BACT|nr:protoporphyrinogen oxidase [Rubripirellula lacrimiformis]QDT05033.1 Protoporphyrinogen oxidase [Rubripirellula lacrimiformis]
MPTCNPKRVAVIGGGISGLAAAHHLRKLDPSLDVQLFESGDRLGGVIRTTETDGFLIEGAADNFITTAPNAIELCRDLGLGQELIPTNPGGGGAMVVSRGKLEPVPPGFMVMAPSRIWPILATRILSPMGKLRSGMEVFVPRKKAAEDESLKSFISRRFGSEMFQRLVQPLVGGIYTADPARLSVAATMPRFLDMEQQHGSLIRGMMSGRRKQSGPAESRGGARHSQFMTLRGGMSRLIDALAASLPSDSVHLNSPIVQLSKASTGWLIEDQNGHRSTADAVVMASPANHAATMLRQVAPKIARRLRRIEYASCAVVSLAFRRDQINAPMNSFGFVVPHVENHLILSCSFSSEKYEGRAPDGTVLMRVFIGGAMQSGLLRLPNDQLIELAHWEVARLLKIDGKPLLRHLTRQSQAMPQYHVGHQQRISDIKEHLADHPTLALAGSSLSGVGVPGCVASGQKAAVEVVAGMKESDAAAQRAGRRREANPSSESSASNS